LEPETLNNPAKQTSSKYFIVQPLFLREFTEFSLNVFSRRRNFESPFLLVLH
jgi:hypothetical protein